MSFFIKEGGGVAGSLVENSIIFIEHFPKLNTFLESVDKT